MEIIIEEICVLEDGDVSVRLTLGSGAHNEKKTFILAPSDFRELKIIRGRNIDKPLYDAIEEAANFRFALKKGVELLSYGANSQATLINKLTRRGFSSDASARAADYLAHRGYINENSDAEAIVESCLAKGYGSRRIMLRLREKGYSDEVLSHAAELLADVDFSENCAGVIAKRCGKIPADRASRDRIVAAMVRYGYSFTEIRDAIRQLDNNNKE